MSDLLRVYLDPAEIGKDGYPIAWHKGDFLPNDEGTLGHLPIKDEIRLRDGERCLRCGHPYRKGQHGNGEWSPCDDHCRHQDDCPVRVIALTDFTPDGMMEVSAGDLLGRFQNYNGGIETALAGWNDWREHGYVAIEAQWRILTVHHLNGVKHDCRWWNLVSLCQRCHLSVQTRVVMDREYDRPHSDWFKPFVCGYYAWAYLGEEISREEADERQDELLALALRQQTLFGADGVTIVAQT